MAIYETRPQGMNLALYGKRTWQHVKFGRIMQAAGSPSRKYESNSLKIFSWASQNTDLFLEKAVPIGLSPPPCK